MEPKHFHQRPLREILSLDKFQSRKDSSTFYTKEISNLRLMFSQSKTPKSSWGEISDVGDSCALLLKKNYATRLRNLEYRIHEQQVSRYLESVENTDVSLPTEIHVGCFPIHDDVTPDFSDFLFYIPTRGADKHNLSHEAFVGLSALNKLHSIVYNFTRVYPAFSQARRFGSNHPTTIGLARENVASSLSLEVWVRETLRSNPARFVQDFLEIYIQVTSTLRVANDAFKYTHYNLGAGNIRIQSARVGYFVFPIYVGSDNLSPLLMRTKHAPNIVGYEYSYIEVDGVPFGTLVSDNQEINGRYMNKSFPMWDVFRLLSDCFCLWLGEIRGNRRRLMKYITTYPSSEIGAQFEMFSLLYSFFCTKKSPVEIARGDAMHETDFYLALDDECFTGGVMKKAAETSHEDFLNYVVSVSHRFLSCWIKSPRAGDFTFGDNLVRAVITGEITNLSEYHIITKAHQGNRNLEDFVRVARKDAYLWRVVSMPVFKLYKEAIRNVLDLLDEITPMLPRLVKTVRELEKKLRDSSLGEREYTAFLEEVVSLKIINRKIDSMYGEISHAKLLKRAKKERRKFIHEPLPFGNFARRTNVFEKLDRFVKKATYSLATCPAKNQDASFSKLAVLENRFREAEHEYESALCDLAKICSGVSLGNLKTNLDTARGLFLESKRMVALSDEIMR